MGFSVTAGHVIFAIALLSAGSYAAASHWRVAGDLDDARRHAASRAEDVVHTSIAVLGTPSHNGETSSLTFFVKNEGSTVLEISGFSYILDGRWNNSLQSGYPTVSGASGTNLLLPGETMEVRMIDITSAPSDIKVVATNGVAAYWRSD